MIRIVLTLLLLSLPQAVSAQTQKLTREAPMGERTSMFGIYPYQSPNKKVDFAYYLIGPENPTRGERYPLIVILHGRSGHAYGGWVLANKITKGELPVFALVPSMPEHVDDWTGKAFWKSDMQNPRPIDHVAILTKRLTAELPIDADRAYITGYSMGGVGTFGMVAAYPDLFAAAVPICGGWHLQQADKFKDIPLWAFHGTKDRIVPVTHTRKIIEAIRAAGGTPDYTEYPNVDHNSWVRAYNEPQLWHWMLSQSRKPLP